MIKPWESFDKFAEDYDFWYEKYDSAYKSELLALKEFLPENLENLRTLEIGTGTGRFAASMGISLGLEPSKAMAKIAKKREIETLLGVAEFLPFKKEKFDLILIVTALEFFKDPLQALNEAKRVLKPGGHLIAGISDKNIRQKYYLGSEVKEHRFSSGAHFLSVSELLDYFLKSEFEKPEICQTLFNKPEKITEVEIPEKGFGKGIFVVLFVKKPL
ncbi:MAG: class I SAM-dependent methyltransferase [Methanosarcina sp.]